MAPAEALVMMRSRASAKEKMKSCGRCMVGWQPGVVKSLTFLGAELFILDLALRRCCLEILKASIVA